MSEPLGLPRGSVRAGIVLALVLATTVVAIFGNDSSFAAFAGILGFAVRDYFAHREQENARAGVVLPEPEEG